jgi:hypothetical protein
VTAIVCKDKRDVNMLNMDHPPVEGNLCDEHEKTHCTRLDTWGMWTRVTIWPTVIPLVDAPGYG